MVASFTYTGQPARVLFGAGRLDEVGTELQRLGRQHALILSTPEQTALAEQTKSALGAHAAGLYTRATMHTPTDVTTHALVELQSLGCDALVALGGGSTIGLSKALALRSGLPQIAVPTTYAGSEMTPILGETENGRKTTLRSPKVVPDVVIYDVELTLSLPPMLSAASGVNALAHAVEALYAQDANPIISLMAEEGIAALARNLPGIVVNPADRNARTDAQYGAWLCGACLGAVGMALHHKVCHVLGGAFNLRHAETHAVILPHVAAYNAEAAPAAMARVGRALRAERAALALFSLNRSLRMPCSLRELGMPEAGIEETAFLIMQDQYWNPRPPERDAVQAMLRRAWAGDPPSS